MSHPQSFQNTVPASRRNIVPFLADPQQTPALHYFDRQHPRRAELEGLVYDVFNQAYGAETTDYSDYLLGLELDGELSGVAGLRIASEVTLFSEQYLQQPVEDYLSAYAGRHVERSSIIEIGNLAMRTRGQARQMFAGLSAFMHTAGYEWIVCTAVSPLFKNFQRMGFEPQRLADADVSRLQGGSDQWGSYYQLNPCVCSGSIPQAYRHMRGAIRARQPVLYRFWQQASRQGACFAGDRHRLKSMGGR